MKIYVNLCLNWINLIHGPLRDQRNDTGEKLDKMESNTIYRITKGDQAAFEAFMDHYSSPLYHYAFSIVKNKETVEELISDVFMEVWRQRKDLLEIEHMSGWLYKITNRKAISVLRHLASIPCQVNIDDLENFNISPLVSPDESMIRQEEMDSLYRAIEELPSKCKHVFSLAKIDKLPYKEISDILNISVATINYHIGFAMNALKNKLRKK